MVGEPDSREKNRAGVYQSTGRGTNGSCKQSLNIVAPCHVLGRLGKGLAMLELWRSIVRSFRSQLSI